MHEIKSPFLILMEEQSYLAQSLESAFEKQNVKVKIVTIAEASSIVISEKPSGYLICTSPELLKKAVSVKVMVDQAIKNKTPVFIMGNIDELNCCGKPSHSRWSWMCSHARLRWAIWSIMSAHR